MTTIKLLRDTFGLKQAEIAEWLGVSRGHVANYEIDRRDFAPSASTRLTKLQLVLANLELNQSKGKKNKPTIRPGRAVMAEKLLKHHSMVCEHKAIKLRWDLEALQKKHEQVLARIVLMETLMADPDSKNSKIDVKWLDYHHARAIRMLDKCDEVPQTKIKLKILMLEKAGKIKMEEL